MRFEYYVLNYDINKNKVIPYNIFRNINVQEYTEKEVKKYLRSPKNYAYKSFDGKEEIYGFDALVKENVFIYTSKEMNVEYDTIIADSIEDVKEQIEEMLVEHWNDEINYLENRISSFQENDD